VSLRLSRVIDDETISELLDRVRDHPEQLAREMWSYIHIRDAARACLLGLTAPVEGHLVVLVDAADTLSALPSDELVARWLPGIPIREHPPGARWSLLSSQRAEKLLGFEPGYSWAATGRV
jgi:nucleoside-diphosphate-sugar epimerase